MKKVSSFSRLHRFALTAALVLSQVLGFGQGIQVKGKVTDNAGAGLESVNIRVKSGREGTVSLPDGSFSLNIPSDKTILVFSRVGFAEQERVAGTGILNIILVPIEENLSNVVIVGYTKQSKSRTSAAISSLNQEELQNRPSPNPVQAMQGKIAGVSIPIQSGQPGAGATNIIIRGGTKPNLYGTGQGSSNGNATTGADNVNPLVVVDGVFRAMDDINPENIETFQVMKDAAATAIYGARGANGVIVITTKAGKFNSKMNITLNQRFIWETQGRDYQYMNAEQYLKLARTTVFNTYDLIDKNNLLNNGGFSAGTRVYTAKGQYGVNVYTTALYDNLVAIEGQEYVNSLLAKGWQVIDDPIKPGTKLIFADNFSDENLWETGLSKVSNIGINGGGENANYNLSIGNTSQSGIFVGTKYKRLDVLGNFGFKLSKNAKLEAMVNYQDIQPNYVENFNNEIFRGTRITPLVRATRDDGRPALGELYSTRNRFHTLYYDDVRVRTERMVSKLAGDITLLKGLHLKPSVSYLMQDYTNQLQVDATPADEVQPSTLRQKFFNSVGTRQLMADLILQYNFSLSANHSFTVLGGSNYTRNLVTSATLGSQRATNDYIFTINEPPTTVINGATVPNVTNFGTSIAETKSASLFGQLNYDNNGRYMASATLRYDGFSNFAPEKQYAMFPSLSAGWNVHKEKWFSIKAISMLKLRGSWGEAGLSDLSLTDTYGGYGVNRYALGSGIFRSNLSNPQLTWETTETSDLAFDAGFFDNRLTITVDWYNKLTKDRLDSKPLPGESPFSSIRFNNGILQNKGIEIEIGATVISSKNFKWRTSFNYSKNNQKILELPNNGREKNRQGGSLIYDPVTKKEVFAGGFAEGERPYETYAYRVEGIFSTEVEAAAWNAKYKDLISTPQGQIAKKHAGDYIFADLNGDNVIDARDVEFVGYRTPNVIGGFQNTFSYKNLSLRVNMDYTMGHLISNLSLARSLGQGRAFNEGAPIQALGNDIWQKEGDVGKKYARFLFADADFGQRNYLRTSFQGTGGSDITPMISKGDFLALREITLSYELPNSILKKIHSTGLTLFATAYNIGYLSNYEGINPETYTGNDQTGYPRPRQFTLGGTLKF